MLALIIFGAALLAVTLFLCFRLMLVATTRAIESRHRAMETILETRRPPETWTVGWRPRVDGASPARRPRLAERAKADLLHRIDRLIAYAGVARFVESEETRSDLLSELQSVREAWDETEAAALLLPPPESDGD